MYIICPRSPEDDRLFYLSFRVLTTTRVSLSVDLLHHNRTCMFAALSFLIPAGGSYSRLYLFAD